MIADGWSIGISTAKDMTNRLVVVNLLKLKLKSLITLFVMLGVFKIAAWKSDVMPQSVVEAIDKLGERDFAAGFEVARKWAWGLDERLGKALS